MEIIDEAKYKEAIKLRPVVKEGVKPIKQITSDEFEKLMVELQNPVKAQKEMIIKVKTFLDQKIADEMETKGTLSDATKRWVDSYTSMLEKLQKAIHGDKSVNLNMHAVSHGDIAKKIREAN